MEVADWDLHAVVRGCTTASFSSTTTTTATATTTSPSKSICFSSLFGNTSEQGGLFGQFLPLPDPFEARNAIEDLHDLYKPFFPSKSQDPLVFSHQNQVNSPVSSINEHKQNQQQQCFQVQRANNYKQSQASSLTNHSGYTPRTKRRKNQLKKVCQVPAEALSSDIWAWRKYGQKPIKGSPYPRGYYRCSSSKGCLARKQVERHRSDPGMFIVTYTAEHNHPAPTHRNSLAGSTRQKAYTPPQTSATTTTDSNNKGSPEKPSCSSPMTSTEDEILASIEGKDMFDDEDDELGGGFSVDTGVSDDFFEGLEELTAPPKSCDVRSSLEHHRLDSIVFPWLSNKDATVASGI